MTSQCFCLTYFTQHFLDFNTHSLPLGLGVGNIRPLALGTTLSPVFPWTLPTLLYIRAWMKTVGLLILSVPFVTFWDLDGYRCTESLWGHHTECFAVHPLMSFYQEGDDFCLFFFPWLFLIYIFWKGYFFIFHLTFAILLALWISPFLFTSSLEDLKKPVSILSLQEWVSLVSRVSALFFY